MLRAISYISTRDCLDSKGSSSQRVMARQAILTAWSPMRSKKETMRRVLDKKRRSAATGCWVANSTNGFFVYLVFHQIYAAVAIQHSAGKLRAAGYQGIEGILDSGLHQPRHTQQVFLDFFHLTHEM